MKKAPSLALGNFFKTKKQIFKADIHKLIKTNQTNYVDPKYGTALNRAIKLKDEQIIAELLARKVDIDKAIYFAIGHEYTLEEIKTLISLSPAELPDEYLYKSVHKGRLDLVKYFIEEKGFDVNTTINNPVHGGAILSIATMEEHTKVIDYLLKKGATPSQGVISAIIKGNVEILKKLFEYGATAHDGYSEDLVALLVNAAIPANDPTYCKSSEVVSPFYRYRY